MKKFFITAIITTLCIAIAVSIDRLDTNKKDSISFSHANAEDPTSQSLKHNTKYKDLLAVKSPHNNTIFTNYTGFELAFNPQNGTPDYVAWELTRDKTDGTTPRSNKFWQDTELEGCPQPSDYTRSGYDRGHLCPAADMKWSSEAMNDCFVMANMTPQTHALNGGAWATLEEKCRIWAKRDSALVIVAGPLYEKSDQKKIGNGKIRVPSAFFKVILAPYLQNPRAIGFIYPNMASPGNMKNYSMTVDQVEELTGLDFFFNLPDELENKIESEAIFSQWNNASSF
ncbi:MAG: DNA/RNA non-specific endonuclease [Prevotella sp.]|nr:DNA/RNA non-specific endonuclease [Prevotella sp.]